MQYQPHSIKCSCHLVQIEVVLSSNFSHLLITFANSFVLDQAGKMEGPDPDGPSVSSDLGPNCLQR